MMLINMFALPSLQANLMVLWLHYGLSIVFENFNYLFRCVFCDFDTININIVEVKSFVKLLTMSWLWLPKGGLDRVF